jgi:hypothetical protein
MTGCRPGSEACSHLARIVSGQTSRRIRMDLDPLLLSRIQFAFVVSFHIIFPAFTIGLAAWLATIEGMHIATRDPIYRRVFDFWLKVFALSFGMGVVSGIVMAFPILSRRLLRHASVRPPYTYDSLRPCVYAATIGAR